MLECHFSWQVKHLVKFWEIAGARNAMFFHTKRVSKVRFSNLRSRRVGFMLGAWSNRLSSGGSI